ncbi:MAG TPA: DoxX family membrane protein [Candidatus Saccharimonadales bacterium]
MKPFSGTPTEQLLRFGLAFVFAYAAISSFLSPGDWVGYFPTFIRQIVSTSILLPLFSAIELGLSIWLLSGLRTKWAALTGVALLAGIVVTNPFLLPITFRDIGLACMALALYFAAKK